jgi:hypothetical protein|nr:MAG TPA: hypothetical protein [Bacteriophage sp.]
MIKVTQNGVDVNIENITIPDSLQKIIAEVIDNK